MLNTNVSAIGNCCKRTLITFKAKKYNTLTFTYTQTMNIYSHTRSVLCFLVMMSSLAEVNKSSAAHFLHAFSVILWLLTIQMFNYITGKRPAVYFTNQKNRCISSLRPLKGHKYHARAPMEYGTVYLLQLLQCLLWLSAYVYAYTSTLTRHTATLYSSRTHRKDLHRGQAHCRDTHSTGPNPTRKRPEILQA